MKSTKNRLFAMVLVLSLVLSSLPHTAVAVAADRIRQSLDGLILNKTEAQAYQPLGDEEYPTDYAVAGALLRQGMRNREEDIVVRFAAPSSVDTYDIFYRINTAAMAHTGNPAEGDYLAVHLADIWSESRRDPTTDVQHYEITYHVEYNTTAQQEAQVDAAVAELLQGLSLEGKSDYEKIHAVYLWMCENITYVDFQTTEDPNAYEKKNTAYHAMIQRCTGSKGFAVLFYRLMLELGIDNRIVESYSLFSAWNMVQLGEYYYFVDASQGARCQNDAEWYDSFLRVDYLYSWGYLSNRYDTADFPYDFPVSETDYPLPSTSCSHIYTADICTGQYFHSRTCTLCQTVQVDYHDFQASDLNQQNHQLICSECGYTTQEAHHWDAGVITLYPTSESAGVLRHTCSDCGGIMDVQLPALGISDSDIPEGESVIAGNQFFVGLKWRLSEDGKLTIFGQGEMYNCSSIYRESREWYAYKDRIKTIVIENGVTAIGGDAFRELDNLITVTIGDTVSVIYADVFYGCPKLSSVMFGQGLTTIYAGAFDCTENLYHVLYAGSEVQWAMVEVYASDNWSIYSPNHYHCTGNEVVGVEDWTCLRCSCYHVYDAGVVTPPSCIDHGYTTYTCMHCGDSYRTDYTEIVPHSYTSEVITQPDYENAGELRYTCAACGHSYTERMGRLESPVEQTPAISYNRNGYDYVNLSRWTTPINSHLVAENGGYTRVEAIGDVLTVERYDENLQFVSRRDIPLELPLFGGVYLCEDYNFVVVGQENLEENNDAEVFRIIRYTKDWVREDAASIRGANTTIPFDAGCLRFARSGDMLYIRTCHEMYMAYDGKNHQANVTLCVDIPAMEVTSQFTHVLNSAYGYVSHSFNQFILVDGTDVLALDHGDAYPRAIVIFRYDGSNGTLDFDEIVPSVNVLEIAESTDHYNDTGVEIGGFEFSDTHYLVAGNSTSQAGGINFKYNQRNIFVTATPKDDFSQSATTITWLTNYAEGDEVDLGTPHLVKLEDGRFFLMWRVDERINCCFITADGQLASEIYDLAGALSDCAPVQVGDQLIWYVTQDSTPVFCTIDLQAPGQVVVPHAHQYEIESMEGTCTTDGWTRYTCTECGYTYTEVFPAEGHDFWEWVRNPTCEEQGYTEHICWNCGYSYMDNFTEPTGHNFKKTSLEPSCTSSGMYYYYCDQCGWGYSEEVPPLGHDMVDVEAKQATCTEDGHSAYYECSRCSYKEGWEVIHAKGHSYTETVTPPTCTKQGYTTHTCTACADAYIDCYTGATGHRNSQVVNAKDATCAEDGYTGDMLCTDCGVIWEVGSVIAATGEHAYGEWVVVMEPTNKTEGLRERTCQHCGHTEQEVIAATTVLLGDLNGDGHVNSRDARALLRYLAGLVTADEIDLTAADFNGDDRINVRDARGILRYIAGMG